MFLKDCVPSSFLKEPQDNDSWDGTPGTGAAPVMVRFGPNDDPIPCYHGRYECKGVFCFGIYSTWLNIKSWNAGGYACSFVDPGLFKKHRCVYDPVARQQMFAAQRENRGAEGTTKEQRVAE